MGVADVLEPGEVKFSKCLLHRHVSSPCARDTVQHE